MAAVLRDHPERAVVPERLQVDGGVDLRSARLEAPARELQAAEHFDVPGNAHIVGLYFEAREATAVLTIEDQRIGGIRHAEPQAAAIACTEPPGGRLGGRRGDRLSPSNPQLAPPLPDQLAAMGQRLGLV